MFHCQENTIEMKLVCSLRQNLSYRVDEIRQGERQVT
jgi:hypothetical protein